MNIKKALRIIVISCLIWNFCFTAEGISVKLRGKLALAGILTTFSYVTYTLVKRDVKNAERKISQLGQTEQIISIERGFDNWEIRHYPNESYYFKNNRFIRQKQTNTNFLYPTFPKPSGIGLLKNKISSRNISPSSMFTDRIVSTYPKWSSSYLLRQHQVHQSVFLYPRQLGDELWLRLESQRLRLMSQK